MELVLVTGNGSGPVIEVTSSDVVCVLDQSFQGTDLADLEGLRGS